MRKLLILLMLIIMAGGAWANAKYTTSNTSYFVEGFMVIDEDGNYFLDDYDSSWIVQCNEDSCRTTIWGSSTSDTYDAGGSYPLTYMFYARAANLKASLGNTPGNYTWWVYSKGTDGKHSGKCGGTYYVEDSLGISDSVYVKGGVLDTVRSAENVEAGTITTVTGDVEGDIYGNVDGHVTFVTNLPDSADMVNGIYDKFTTGSNEDAFKATSVTVSDKSGFSLAAGDLTINKFGADYDDSILAIVNSQTKTGFALSDAANEAIADSVLKDAASYKATGFSTHSAADVYTEFTSGSNEDAFKATGFSTFDYTTNKVQIQDSTTGDISYIANNQGDYKATGFSTFDPASDSVLIDYAAIEDTMAAHASTYKATSVTVSDKTGFSLSALAYAAIKDTFDLAFPSDSTSLYSGIWSRSTRILTALDEDNTTIDLDGSTVGDVTNTVTFDNTSIATVTTVTNLPDSADMVNGVYDKFTTGSNEDAFKATSVTVSDKSGFSLAAGDLTINKFGADYDDSILAIVNNRSAVGDTNKTNPTLDSTSLDNIVDLAMADYGISTLTDADKIGINLDNVDGTLDEGEIGSDAITSAQIAPNAIGFSEIAADAIGASELATDAAQEIQANVWQNIDTSATVDTSDIGAWMVNNITGSGPTAQQIWEYGTRLLTELDEDNTTIDLDGTTIGTVTTATTVTNVTEDIQGEVWSEGTRTITGDTYTPDVNVVSAGADAFDSTDFKIGFWHYVTNYSGVGSTDTLMIKTMLQNLWIDIDDYSEDLANDSASFLWLVYWSGDTLRYFDASSDTLLYVRFVDTVLYADSLGKGAAASIDYQKVADSTWLATLSSGHRVIDTAEVLRKLEVDAIERLDITSDFYDTLTAIIGDAVWEEDLSGHGDPTDAGLALSSVFSATDGSGTDGIESDIADLATDIITVISYTDGDGSDGIDADIATIKSYTDGDSTDGIDGMIAVISASVPDSLLEAINMIRLARLAIGWPGSSLEWDSLDGNVHNALDSLLSFYFRSDTLFKQWTYDTLSGGIAATVPDSLFDTLTAIHEGIIAFSGSGSEAETLIVLSSTDTTQISGAKITIRTLDQSTTEVPGKYTDTNGKLILELSDGVGIDSFYVVASHNNYIPITDTIAVASGGGTDTLWMTVFDPGSPAEPEQCRLYGYIYAQGGVPIKNATVNAIIPDNYWPITYDGIAILAKETANTDDDGLWYIDLYPNSLLLTQQGDSSSVYVITGTYRSELLFGYTITVPDTASIDVADLEKQ